MPPIGDEKRTSATADRKPETNPFSRQTQPREYTLWEHRNGPQISVMVHRRPDGKKVPVRLASINGVEWWAESGQTMDVPMEVARIAHAADIVMGPEPDRPHALKETGVPSPVLAHHSNPAKEDPSRRIG